MPTLPASHPYSLPALAEFPRRALFSTLSPPAVVSKLFPNAGGRASWPLRSSTSCKLVFFLFFFFFFCVGDASGSFCLACAVASYACDSRSFPSSFIERLSLFCIVIVANGITQVINNDIIIKYYSKQSKYVFTRLTHSMKGRERKERRTFITRGMEIHPSR